MAEPHTTPGEHDTPVVQPGKPTPDDPRKEAPIKDPPVNPEHDIDEPEPVRQARDREEKGSRILYDEDRVPG
jgi:hypothetical protein